MTPWGEAILLAEKPGLGRVWDCGECGNIHVSIGPVTVCLDPTAYMELVAMLNASAASFEEWIQYKQNGGSLSCQKPQSPGACFPERPAPKADQSFDDERQP
jgi:hypothetical protein